MLRIKDLMDVKFASHIFDKIMFGSSVKVSVELSPERVCQEARYAIIKLREEIWSQKIQNEKVALAVHYPLTWWQHFKQDCFPNWALRRWPVLKKMETKTFTFKTVALFPDFKYSVPSGVGNFVLSTIVSEET
jgi:hypothetical protein